MQFIMCALNVEKQIKFNLQVYDNTDWWWNSWIIKLIDTYPFNSSSNTIVCISNSLSSLHRLIVDKAIHLMYFTVSQHKCPNLQNLQASDGWNESILVYFTVFQLYVQISKFSRHQMDGMSQSWCISLYFTCMSKFQILQASDGWYESILVYFTVFHLYVQISKFSRHQMDGICSCLDIFWSDIGHMISI